MKIYSAHGINEFVVCCGYKGNMIKEYFADYFMHKSDVTFDLAGNRMEVHKTAIEPWRGTLVDTGDDTMTGGRLKRVRSYIGDEDFCFTYGDGVSNVDIKALVAFHKAQETIATLTAIKPPGRFGSVEIRGKRVANFLEKPPGDGGWVNGGFFVLSPRALDYIDGDATLWEREPMETLAREGNLAAFRHEGFWQPMDTMRDKILLEELWKSGKAPWKIWP